MFPRCVKALGHLLLLGVLALSACSSSPPKDKVEPAASVKPNPAQASTDTKSSTKSSGRKVGAEVVATEPAPVGPPPIPPEATEKFERALTLLGAGDDVQAGKELQALADQYPDYSGPMANLGILYLKKNKLPEAEKALLAATQRGEPNAATFNQLGIVYRKLGKFKEADHAYSEAARIDPNYALAQLNLGVLCDMYLQQPQRALEAFERYMQLNSNPDARVAGWIKELQSRLGIKAQPPSPAPQPAEPTASVSTENAPPTEAPK